MDRKRPGRRGLISASLLLLLICLLAVVAMAASDQDSTTITGNVVDTTSPAAVTDLAVTSASYTSLTLSWTAPGDDGNLGTAAEYDIRYSTSTITEANWDSATQCSGEPIPSAAGNTETFIVTGLSPGTTYYFGLKTADEVPNWSDLSNIPAGVTLGGGDGGGDAVLFGGPECPTGEVSTASRATSAGLIIQSFVVTSFDKRFSLILDEGIVVLTPDGTCPRCIGIHEMAQSPSPPVGAYIISVMYDVVPDETTFTPPATLKYSYDPNDIPEGIAEESLVIACYNKASGEWTELDSVVDTEANTITAKVSQIYDLAVLGYEAVAPAAFEIGWLSIIPTKVDIGGTVNITVFVANTGGQSGAYEVILKINGVIEAESEVTLDAGASEQVSFSIARDTAGTYSVDVNGLTSTFKVKPEPVAPVTPPPPVEPTPAKPVNWWLIGGIIAAAAALAFVIYSFRERLSPLLQSLLRLLQRLSPLLQRLLRLLPRKWGQAVVETPAGRETMPLGPLPELWNKTYITPGKVMVSNFYPGARAEYPLTIHNGKDEPAEFSVTYTYRQPGDAEEGYVTAPGAAQDWIIIADPAPVLEAKETRDVLIAVEMPEDAEAPPKWEFWIEVKDVTQEGMVQTELAYRWRVTMGD